MYPRAFRGALPRQLGMTVGGGYSYRHYPDPAAYHIGAMWNGFAGENEARGVRSMLYAWPTGYIDRGMRLAKVPVPGPCKGCDPSPDAHVAACLGIYADYDAGEDPFALTCQGVWRLDQCRATQARVAPRTYGPVRWRGAYYTIQPVR